MLGTSLTVIPWFILSGTAFPAYIPRANGGITADQVLAIAPTANDCGGAPYPGECRTAAQAAPWISNAFATYGVTNIAEQSALISWMAFETTDFRFNKNHYPGTPGQGTRNMQSLSFNTEYARSIPAIASKVDSVAGSPDALLNLVLPDEYSFASAAWFLTSKCSADVRSALQSGTEAGWDSFMSNCVYTPPSADRKAYWARANSALSQGSGTGAPVAASVAAPNRGSGFSPSQDSSAPGATLIPFVSNSSGSTDRNSKGFLLRAVFICTTAHLLLYLGIQLD